MKMTEQEIRYAAEAIIKLRTRRDSQQNDTRLYDKRPAIDRKLDDMRARKEADVTAL